MQGYSISVFDDYMEILKDGELKAVISINDDVKNKINIFASTLREFEEVEGILKKSKLIKQILG
jgi:hypothetical protein